jgi:hypothetical protein
MAEQPQLVADLTRTWLTSAIARRSNSGIPVGPGCCRSERAGASA